MALVDGDRGDGTAPRRLDEGAPLIRKELRVAGGVEPTVRCLPALGHDLGRRVELAVDLCHGVADHRVAVGLVERVEILLLDAVR